MTDESPPSLLTQTRALGETLKAIAAPNPLAPPPPQAAAVFAAWLAEAGPGSREPRYFADVAENFDTQACTSAELFEMFEILENYLAAEEQDDEDDPRGSFIPLPLAGGESLSS